MMKSADNSNEVNDNILDDSQIGNDSSERGARSNETETQDQLADEEISPGNGYTRVSDELNFFQDNGYEYPFWQHKKEGRTHIQCGYHIRTNSGSVIWCTYDKRIDHHRNCYGKHVHAYLTTKQKKLEDFTRSTHVTRCKAVYNQIAHFAAISNLSLEMAASQHLFDIIYTAIEYYKENSVQFFKQPPSKIIPKISAATVRTLMIKSAEDIVKKNIENLKFENYISICLDAGTTKSRHFIDIAIWTPRTTFSVFVKETPSLTANGYAKLAIECLTDPRLSQIKGKISAFVGDGLRSQVAGLTPGKRDCFQSLIKDPDLRKIFFSPCYNHRLQNAIKKTFKEDAIFKRYVNWIHEFSVFLRKPDNILKLGVVCPEAIETRWNYLFDICAFIKKYKDPIIALLMEYNMYITLSDEVLQVEEEEDTLLDNTKSNYQIVLDTIDKLLQILWPFKAATLCLSYENCSLAKVYPIFTDLIAKYETVKDELHPSDQFVSVINKIIKNIKSQTFAAPEMPLFYLAYMLTPAGRSLLYKQEKGFSLENDDSQIQFQPYVIPDFETVFNKSKIKRIEQAEDVAAIQDIHLTNQGNSNDDEFEHNDSSNKFDDNSDKSNSDDNNKIDEESDDNQITQTRYEICKKALDILIEYLHIPSESNAPNIHNNLFNILDKWIDAPHDELPHCELITNDNPMEIWVRIKESTRFQKWHQLADIALRLYGISASETICERIISLQGHISKDRAQKAKGELSDARLIHMQNRDAVFK